MCIEKHLALFAKSPAGYIKHLETELLEHGPGTYHRCDVCARVGHEDNMSMRGDFWVCEGRCENRLDEISGSDEDTYRKYKASEYGW